MHHEQTSPAIDARGIGKRFGIRWVLRGVTLSVAPGEAVGLLGANGSGKSTILRVLGTLLKPNAGSGTIGGLDLVSESSRVRECVGYLAHTPGLYEDLTARENLSFAADMLGMSHESIDGIMERVGLGHVSSHRVRGFSAGMQRRLALARLIMKRPTILLLDEPYSNLDQDGVDLMNSVIAEILDRGGAALLALHELTPAQEILSRTLTLADGRIRSSGIEREAEATLMVGA